MPVIDVKPNPAWQALVKWPSANLQSSRPQLVDSRPKPQVAFRAGEKRCDAEVVERTQDFVTPAVGVREVQKPIVCGLAGCQAEEKVSLQKIFFARPAYRLGFKRASGSAFKFQQTFQHIDGGGERRAHRAVGALTVPAAVVLSLFNQPVHNGRDIDTEVRPVCDRSAVNALLYFAFPKRLTTFIPA